MYISFFCVYISLASGSQREPHLQWNIGGVGSSGVGHVHFMYISCCLCIILRVGYAKISRRRGKFQWNMGFRQSCGIKLPKSSTNILVAVIDAKCKSLCLLLSGSLCHITPTIAPFSKKKTTHKYMYNHLIAMKSGKSIQYCFGSLA